MWTSAGQGAAKTRPGRAACARPWGGALVEPAGAGLGLALALSPADGAVARCTGRPPTTFNLLRGHRACHRALPLPLPRHKP
jgi:hypothetical protein